ncbi:DUF2917 domain-containing protein [Paraburkholderia bonniea]|uniref:DUF2917 domain-containing protein n=1 Tax=Paraburkholderia bonniea TaxID=2152891 RepID=UPI0012925B06|nr:DUF2917 domain-containing protein [Paraburkholderia bonniea]
MREIRTYELDHGEAPVAWCATQPFVVTITAGEVWLTLAGQLGDHWLAAGESLALPRGTRVWVSAGPNGAQVKLALPASWIAPSLAWRGGWGRVLRWLPLAVMPDRV